MAQIGRFKFPNAANVVALADGVFTSAGVSSQGLPVAVSGPCPTKGQLYIEGVVQASLQHVLGPQPSVLKNVYFKFATSAIGDGAGNFAVSSIAVMAGFIGDTTFSINSVLSGSDWVVNLDPSNPSDPFEYQFVYWTRQLRRQV